MKIELHEIPISQVAEGYTESETDGVKGYGGKLDIRPPFQREFIYKDSQRDEVIRSIKRNFPLNVMYWVVNDGGMYEMLDGQQRTISICRYIQGAFQVDRMRFDSLTDAEKKHFLEYKLMVYFCEGDEREKWDWFNIVNIAGERLTPQELRNTVYPGAWLAHAKSLFSKRNGPAYNLASNYMRGEPIRQEYLEKVLEWYSEYRGFKGKSDERIRECMSDCQHKSDAGGMWLYFQNVISWVQCLFPTYRTEMKGINWGVYFNTYHDREFDSVELERRYLVLAEDDDVTSPSGIYEYLIDGNEKHLSLRSFSPKQKRSAYERQQGICAHCGKHFEFEQMEADHITPWREGGRTTPENCQMLCRTCNRKKGDS